MTGCGENSNNNSLKGSKVTITDINGNSTELTMDEFKSKVEGNVTSFNNKYLTNPEVEDDFEDKLKLKPLVSDDEVYSKIIMNQQDILTNDEKKSNVYKNYVYIKNKLKSLFFSYSIEDLLEALDKFYFVIILSKFFSYSIIILVIFFIKNFFCFIFSFISINKFSNTSNNIILIFSCNRHFMTYCIIISINISII